MSTSHTFTQGNWYMGAGDRGIFVSRKTIKEKVEGLGFADVIVLDRTELGHQLPSGPEAPTAGPDDAPTALPFPPSALPANASNEWDTFVSARYTGPSGPVEIPVSPDRVAWVVDAGPVSAGATAAALPAPKGESFPTSGAGKGSDAGTGAPVGKIVYGAVALASTVVCVYHGTKRNDSVGWGLGWGLLGIVLGPLAVVAALAQGIGKRKKEEKASAAA